MLYVYLIVGLIIGTYVGLILSLFLANAKIKEEMLFSK